MSDDWIPCADRLPPPETKVAIAWQGIETCDMPVYHSGDAWHFWANDWIEKELHHEFVDDPRGEPTHWRPWFEVPEVKK